VTGWVSGSALVGLGLLMVSTGAAQVPVKRAFSLDDLARIRTVSDPAVSPDGGWVSYTVSTVDTVRDRRQSDIWMTSWDGSRTVRLTSSPESEHGAKWSPDGRWLAFLSERGEANDVGQLWLLDRAGGEAQRVTGFRGGVTDYDWGHKDAEDVLAAVDYAVRAGIANIFAGYGTDEYVREYEAELGVPWQQTAAWSKVSFPFLHADRIVTPTLFLCGERGFNVPLQNSEQMYQALRSLGRETRLVIYPGEYHTIRRPSFVRDRLQRYAEWYDKYLK
jgi:dipeptidyl aminopeptidase/acylaminoacyl peptidase